MVYTNVTLEQVIDLCDAFAVLAWSDDGGTAHEIPDWLSAWLSRLTEDQDCY